MQITGYGVFAAVIVLLLVSWSLVTFWQRFLENFVYNTLGLDPESTTMALLIALGTTGAFLLAVWIIKEVGLIPNVDFLIYDYNEEGTALGGPLEGVRGQRFRAQTIGRKVSPRGALNTILQQ